MRGLDDRCDRHAFKESLLGRCTEPHRNYVSHSDAMKIVRKAQPLQKAAFVRSLEDKLGSLLNERVLFFTAVRSTLDVSHGRDGFFVVGDTIASVVITTNSLKSHGKADIVINKDDVENISKLALRIATEIRYKLPVRVL